MSARTDTILVVDDDDGFLKRVWRTLEAAGFSEVLVAADVPTAEKLARAHRPRIALIDLHLGEDKRSGFSLVTLFKTEHPFSLPVILSGDRSPQQFFRAARIGAVDFLVKGPSLDLPREVIRILDGERGAVVGSSLPKITSDLNYLRLLGLTLQEVQTVSELARGFPETPDRASPTDRVLERICAKLGVEDPRHLFRSLAICELYREGNSLQGTW